MDLVSTTRERIFAAADALYEEVGRSEFPTVDAVRKSARVNMNDANSGMREWRRLQMSRAAPVTVQVPDAVQIAANLALGSLWKTAQELANESLTVARVRTAVMVSGAGTPTFLSFRSAGPLVAESARTRKCAR